MKLYKLGDQWFQLEGWKLTPIDTPAEAPAEGTFVDGDALLAEITGLKTLDDVAGKTNDLITEYNTLRTEAATDPAKLEDARAAKELAAIATHLHTERKTALDELGELPEDSTPPNKPADDGGGDKDGEGDADKDSDKDGEAGDAGDGDGDGDGEGEGGEGDGGVPDDISSIAGDLVAVSAAAAALRGGGDPSEVLAGLMPGRAPAVPSPADRGELASITAAAGLGIDSGAEMTLEDITSAHRRFASGTKRGRLPGSSSIGSFQLFGAEPHLAVSASAVDAAEGKVEASAAASFHARRAGSRGVTAAAPERCGPADVRQEIKYAGDDSSPLLALLESYPAPHCELEYYRDITLADVADGVGIWTTAARDAYQNALDAWRADPTAANLAALKGAEKQCAIAGCPPTDTVDMLPVYACLEYPTDLEYCAPEAIRAYLRTLNRAWIRERSANFLAVIATKSARIAVDSSAAPFINTNEFDFDGSTAAVQLGATAVIDYVMSTVMGMGVMAERITAANYTAVMPYGLQRLLEFEGRLAEGVSDLSEALGGVRVVTTLDTATGTALPWSSVPTQDGSSVDFTTILPPTDWDLAVLDLDDWFAISRPDIELGAQITPESIKGNMVFGGFMESHEGYGKDGAHPSWTLGLSNLVYNGARPGKMRPVGVLA